VIRAQAGDTFMMVLEPGNWDRLKAQKPISVDVPAGTRKVVILYTPDAAYLAELVAQGVPMLDAHQASLTRPEVHERPQITPEPQFKNIRISGEEA
jgi:hypothetical protein